MDMNDILLWDLALPEEREALGLSEPTLAQRRKAHQLEALSLGPVPRERRDVAEAANQ